MKVLVATEKPFAAVAVEGIRKEIEGAGNELVLLEKYTEKAQLLDAVKDADALIVRSDKVTPEVLDAAANLKIVVRDGFAAARLADDCQGFSLVQIEVDAAYCLNFARVGTERNSQIFNFKFRKFNHGAYASVQGTPRFLWFCASYFC